MEMLGLKWTLASRWIIEPGLSTGSFSVALESSEEMCGFSGTSLRLSHQGQGHQTYPRPPPTSVLAPIPTASPFQSSPPVLVLPPRLGFPALQSYSTFLDPSMGLRRTTSPIRGRADPQTPLWYQAQDWEHLNAPPSKALYLLHKDRGEFLQGQPSFLVVLALGPARRRH